MTAFDAHAHVIVPELLRDSDPGTEASWRPSVTRRDGRQVVALDGREILSAVREFVDLGQILEDRAAAGVDRVLLCPWVPLLYYDVPAATGQTRCRLQNEGLARLHSREPNRVSVLGAVPLQDPELAADELRVLMAGGTFAGVEITASVNGIYIGDPRFAPFWAAAEQCDALVFVHPTTRGFSDPAFAERYLWNLVGNPMETTLAAAHLILSGTLTRHPGLRVLLAHGGGAIVSLAGRLRHGQQHVAAAGPPPATAQDAADALIGRFLFDTVTHDPRLLADLIAYVGADRVLLGSDYPFDMADPDPVATVQAAGLDARAQAAVLTGNAERELLRTAPRDTGAGHG
ncbi:MAG TPA: amidohydrolase family protein [Solirubrobacteraceae bacterium]|nr:amidohydrolase family protein [Solirubrobacteraceae bacterium]